jgi:ElaB/YqjD/DUF883 family membrane-anchored ribosome-binding protein
MDVDDNLQDAFREWRRLADTEGEAIRTRNWSLVTDCQKALQHLQPKITGHLREAREEWTRLGPDADAKSTALRAAVAELIEIESQNNTLLNTLRQATLVRLDQLGQASRTLRQLHRSYAPAHPTAWTSFS